jgi:hypothetical protein
MNAVGIQFRNTAWKKIIKKKLNLGSESRGERQKAKAAKFDSEAFNIVSILPLLDLQGPNVTSAFTLTTIPGTPSSNSVPYIPSQTRPPTRTFL